MTIVYTNRSTFLVCKSIYLINRPLQILSDSREWVKNNVKLTYRCVETTCRCLPEILRSEAGGRLLAEMSSRVFTQANKINNAVTKCGVTVSPQNSYTRRLGTQGTMSRVLQRFTASIYLCFGCRSLWIIHLPTNQFRVWLTRCVIEVSTYKRCTGDKK